MFQTFYNDYTKYFDQLKKLSKNNPVELGQLEIDPTKENLLKSILNLFQS